MNRVISFLNFSFLIIFFVLGTNVEAIQFDGHDYVVINAPGITWDYANNNILTLGSGYYLATISSAAENTFIDSLVEGNEYWIGGYQEVGAIEPGGSWYWVNGEGLFWDSGPITGVYSNWGPIWDPGLEPNNTCTTYCPENHLAIVGTTGYWNDEGYLPNIVGIVAECSLENLDRCEAPEYIHMSVPEPASLALMVIGITGIAFSRRKRIH